MQPLSLYNEPALPLIAQLLQFVVGLYGLRLYRRFGPRRIGWWLTGAYSLQAVLCLIHFSGSGPVGPLKVDILYLALSLMLLAAMIHVERVQMERTHFEQEQLRIQAGLEDAVRDKTEQLARANDNLRDELQRHKEYEDALRSSEQQYRLLFQENPQPMWVYERTSLRFLAVNGAAQQVFGLSDEKLPSVTAKDLRPAEDIASFLRDNGIAAPKVEHRGVWRLYRKDGQVAQVHQVVMDISYNGFPARLVLATDITEKLDLEQKLRQAQKMEAVGQLAGGVAHDFNNILTVIQGYADLLVIGGRYPEIADPLRQISQASKRAASLTRQLLAFSRRNHLQLAPVDLNEVVNNISKMLRRLIGEDIELETTLGKIRAVRADTGMLEQVLLNLTVNARDAIQNGGEISINTSMLEVTKEDAARHREAKPGWFVMMAVRDSGCGMAPEVVRHLFEPFFTTKEVGKGTGLGLATVYGIIQQHSGWIEVETAVGCGTEFRIFLPVSDHEIVSQTKSEQTGHWTKGRGTILLVEDEEAVREFAGVVLEQHGYRVIPANSAREALDIWENRDHDIDLIFTDMVMPGGMSGRDLAEAVKKESPGARIVFTSGHSPSRYGQEQGLLRGLEFLPKPYNPKNLLSTVNEAMEKQLEEGVVKHT